MEWIYIAGLFDGEGHFTIALQKRKAKSQAILFVASITGESKKAWQPISSFLEKENISFSYHINKKIYGWTKHESCAILIQRDKDTKKFAEKIYPFLIFKKPQCKIILKAIKLKEELKKKYYGAIIDNLNLFDELRHELHKYAKKGPKVLESWA